jgi:hypothetical protein
MPPSWNDPGTVDFADMSPTFTGFQSDRWLAAEQPQKGARIHDSKALVFFKRQ